MAAYDPRNHTKRHETRAFFVRFRVTSWIVLFILTNKKWGALIKTDAARSLRTASLNLSYNLLATASGSDFGLQYLILTLKLPLLSLKSSSLMARYKRPSTGAVNVNWLPIRNG